MYFWGKFPKLSEFGWWLITCYSGWKFKAIIINWINHHPECCIEALPVTQINKFVWFFLFHCLISDCLWQSPRAPRPCPEACGEKQRNFCGSCEHSAEQCAAQWREVVPTGKQCHLNLLQDDSIICLLMFLYPISQGAFCLSCPWEQAVICWAPLPTFLTIRLLS